MSWTEDDVKTIDAHDVPPNILPDSRLNGEAKGIVRGYHPLVGSINWQPIYCANCGVLDGYYPVENIDFAFALCPKCAERWGNLAGTMLMPDEVYWKRVEQFQIEKYGRVLPKPDFQRMIDSDHELRLLLKIS
jgi:hypothetical protein